MTTSNMLRDLKEAFMAMVRSITIVNGCVSDMVEENVFPDYQQVNASDMRDDNYPRCFVLLANGEETLGISETYDQQLSYRFIFVFRKVRDDQPDVQDQIVDMIQDFRRTLYRNASLGGLVTQLSLRGYSTDEGALYPEGALTLFVECTTFNQGATD